MKKNYLVSAFQKTAAERFPDQAERLNWALEKRMAELWEEFQGQGYMRQVMDLAFREGDRLGVPVVLNTDAWSKCVKYQRLGMELAGTRDVGDRWELYDLIRYPAPSGGDKASTHKRKEDSQ